MRFPRLIPSPAGSSAPVAPSQRPACRASRIAAAAIALWIGLAALPRPAQAQDVDPFYQSRLDDGKSQYLAGDYAAAAESLQVAAFGFLDSPDRLLESYVYLLLTQYALKNEERAGYYRSEIRRLRLEDRLPRIGLPTAVRTRYDEINAAFARMEARLAGRPVEDRPADKAAPAVVRAIPAPLPAPPPAQAGKTGTAAEKKAPAAAPSTKIDVAAAAEYIKQARAETRLNRKIALYKQALEYDSGDLNTYFEMSDAYTAVGKYREAADLLETLSLYYPDDTRVMVRLAESQIADRAYEKAYKTLIQAVKRDGQDLDIRYLLARANIGLKRYREAAAQLDIVLSGSPAFKDAQALRDLCAGKLR